MRPVLVVVGHVHIKHTLEVPLVQNQHPIEAFRANRTHEPFGHAVRLRRANRRATNLDLPFGCNKQRRMAARVGKRRRSKNRPCFRLLTGDRWVESSLRSQSLKI
jgi:hypothetical protein